MDSSRTVPDVAGRDLAPRSTLSEPALAAIKGLSKTLSYVLGEIYLQNELRPLVEIVTALDEFGRELRIAQSEAHGAAGQLMGKEKKLDLGVGIGVVERYTSSDTKWHNADLVKAIAQHCPPAVDPNTGSVTIDGVRALQLIQECCAVAYWRKAPLRKLGLDPDEYSETSWGSRRIRVSQEARDAVHRGAESRGTQAGGA